MKNLTPSVSARRPAIAFLALIVVVAGTSGCARHQVRTPTSDPLVEVYETEAPNAFFWGLYVSPQVVTADCSGSGLNDVVIKRNYFQDLASVITLGIWMPASLEYRCRAPHGDGGAFPEAPAQPANQS